jgi:hypothetical protein
MSELEKLVKESVVHKATVEFNNLKALITKSNKPIEEENIYTTIFGNSENDLAVLAKNRCATAYYEIEDNTEQIIELDSNFKNVYLGYTALELLFKTNKEEYNKLIKTW